MSIHSKPLLFLVVFLINIGVWGQSSSINNKSIKQIAAGGHHCVVLLTDGHLWAWGRNTGGQLGDGSTIDRIDPVQIGFEKTWASVTAGKGFTHAIKKDGTLWGWGINKVGQLGISTTNFKFMYSSPTQVGKDNDWQMVSSGKNFTIGLKTDGTIWVWGANIYHLIKEKINQYEPIKIDDKNNKNWKQIAAGDEFFMAIKRNGSLWTMGKINGDNMAFVKINDDRDWASMDAGTRHAMAIKNDDSLWSWGYNNHGQLGNGTTTNSKNPIKIGENYSAVSTTGHYTGAINKNGIGVWWWGKSVISRKMQSTPVQMPGTSYLEFIATGDDTLYLLMDELSILEFSQNNEIGNFSLKRIK